MHFLIQELLVLTEQYNMLSAIGVVNQGIVDKAYYDDVTATLIKHKSLESIPTNNAKFEVVSTLISALRVNTEESTIQNDNVKSPSQKLWSMDKKSHNVVRFNISEKLRIKKSIDLQATKKRIKAVFNNYMYDRLSYLLKDQSKDVFISKLPGCYSTTISKVFNRSMFLKTIEELYSNFSSLDPEGKKRANHNKSIMQMKHLPEEFITLKSKLVKDIYIEFLQSEEYTKVYEKLKTKYDEDYAIYFTNVAKGFLKRLKLE
jgi:hypothetical protein